jgi:hypothetical protein
MRTRKGLRSMRSVRKKCSKRTRKQKGGMRQLFVTNHLEDALYYIREYTIDQQLEYCGTIEKRPAKQKGETTTFAVMLHEAQRPSGNRPSCAHEPHPHRLIWHNHPQTSKYYPSVEDILNAIKRSPRNNTSTSYLFCEFGMWDIRVLQYIDVSAEIKKYIKGVLDQFYFMTNRGRTFDRPAIQWMKEAFESSPILQGVFTITFTLMPPYEMLHNNGSTNLV